MLSYTGRRNLFGDLTNNSSSAHLTLGDTLMNSSMYRTLGLRPWWFLYTTATDATVASQANYPLPGDCAKLVSDPYITVSSTRYTPRRIASWEDWNRLNDVTRTSDIPEFYIVLGEQVYFWPAPVTAGSTITFPYRKKVRPLSIADYTTGTVTMTNGSTAVAGAGTTFVADMAKRYIRATTGSAGGDGIWYKIATFTSTTALVLAREYAGTTAAGASFIIGECSGLPDGYDEIDVYRACEVYFTSIKPDKDKATMYKRLADELTVALVDEHGSPTDQVAWDDAVSSTINNPNLYVSL